MAQRTIARMYDTYDDAKAVVHDLEGAGVPHSEISLIANADAHGRSSGTSAMTAGGDHPLDPADRDDTDTGAGGKRGAVLGGVLGGGAGYWLGSVRWQYPVSVRSWPRAGLWPLWPARASARRPEVLLAR